VRFRETGVLDTEVTPGSSSSRTSQSDLHGTVVTRLS
jgi:hypothetical protein